MFQTWHARFCQSVCHRKSSSNDGRQLLFGNSDDLYAETASGMVSAGWCQSWNCFGRGVNDTDMFAIESETGGWQPIDLPYEKVFHSLCFVPWWSVNLYLLNTFYFHVEKLHCLKLDMATQKAMTVRQKICQYHAVLPEFYHDASWQNATRSENALVWALGRPQETSTNISLFYSDYVHL